MQKSPSTEQVESKEKIEQVRTLILGENSRLVTDIIKKDARNIVGDVLTEALHDRQSKDGSVNKVLLPLVEDSVEHSVTHHSDKLVSSLYPLMGSLVRKSVTAFLTDFMEKTNQLIDNSFTIKGMKWRFEARRAGVNFSQYVASQTFVYRVEHVFLIHRETGLLLSSAALNNVEKSDADLISSMLTAINDFVGDSFLTNEDGLKEQLQTVTTDNFNLLIKPGPKAFVVAAITGNPPQAVSNQLQLTLEGIHSLYHNELSQFDGDNQTFVNSETQLRDCLLSEQKTAESTSSKTPWFSWFLVLSLVVFISFQMFLWWGKVQLTDKIMMLDSQDGIIINHIEVQNDQKVELDILRDPDAITVSSWLEQQGLSIEQLLLTERRYQSMAPEILKSRVERIMLQYPEVKTTWNEGVLVLSGSLDFLKTEKLNSLLTVAGFNNEHNLKNEIQLPSSAIDATKESVQYQLFNTLVGRISTIQLEFSVASDEVTSEMQLTLQRLYQYLLQLEQLANDLNVNYGLVIMGSSDNSGNKTTNTMLSLQRAQNTANALNQQGFSKQQMYITGLGQIEMKNVQNKARKVMFNVLYVNKNEL